MSSAWSGVVCYAPLLTPACAAKGGGGLRRQRCAAFQSNDARTPRLLLGARFHTKAPRGIPACRAGRVSRRFLGKSRLLAAPRLLSASSPAGGGGGGNRIPDAAAAAAAGCRRCCDGLALARRSLAPLPGSCVLFYSYPPGSARLGYASHRLLPAVVHRGMRGVCRRLNESDAGTRTLHEGTAFGGTLHGGGCVTCRGRERGGTGVSEIYVLIARNVFSLAELADTRVENGNGLARESGLEVRRCRGNLLDRKQKKKKKNWMF
ncbi:hypothetical protein HPB48_019726 [Haemaphysalis longicornis]|uniref:Uncharacterized protein n=1 Tax=Haemaphysalis longicornis TaxID=44386 RepID=A0A9J6FXQ7_HAELO|nr:hypothetical protein HPB48_019726 [Haemaphysalis longicornis]